MSVYMSQFSSSPSKLVRSFERSRDRWKVKCQAAKTDCKLAKNQVRAVEKSRAKWRARALAAEQEVRSLQREIEDLKCATVR